MKKERSSTLKTSLFQLNSTPSIKENKSQILNLIKTNDVQNSDLWTFPECALHRPRTQDESQSFNLNDTIIPWFSELAKQHEKWILVGSFFYKQNGLKLPTNTSVLIDPTGTIKQTYDKIHLFDVSLDNLSFCESSNFAAGSKPKTATINNFNCGFSICFDCRFPELYRIYAQQKCDIIFIPSSFTKSTGTKHWHTLCKSRAIENQAYVIAPNQCGIGGNGADTYGHSLIIDPFGEIIAEGSATRPEVIHATLNMSRLKFIRDLFPLLNARKL